MLAHQLQRELDHIRPSLPRHGLRGTLETPRLGYGPRIDDLAQDTFLRVVTALRSFSPRPEVGLSAWICSIAVNIARDELRRVSIRSESAKESHELAEGSQYPPMPERAVALRQALSALDEMTREAFVLCECDGMSYREIATIMEVAPNTARALVIEAKHRLRIRLGEP
jgi:RNA polymerase sigma-70 factor, ECF subfamily